MKRIRQGNSISFHYGVYRSLGILKEPEDLTGIGITASLQNLLSGIVINTSFFTKGNVVTTDIPGIPYIPIGTYNFSLSYHKNGRDFAIDTDAFQIVDSSAKVGGSDTCPDMQTETVELSGALDWGAAGGSGTEQVQADWKESNEQSKAFIKNKPILSKVASSGSYRDLSDKPVIPSVTNDFTNEEKEKLAGLRNYDDIPLRTALQDEINRATQEEGTIREAVEKVASDFSSFLSSDPDADDLINRWQEVVSFLNGITEDKTLSGMLFELKGQINESVAVKLSNYYTAGRVDELFVKKLVGSRLMTGEEATKLAELHNYDDTEVRDLIEEKADVLPAKAVSDPNGSVEVYPIDPNVFYDFDLCAVLHVSLNPPTDRGIFNEYMFQFIAAEDNIPFTVDDNIKWLTDVPAMKANHIYEVSIVNGIGVIGGTSYVEV